MLWLWCFCRFRGFFSACFGFLRFSRLRVFSFFRFFAALAKTKNTKSRTQTHKTRRNTKLATIHRLPSHVLDFRRFLCCFLWVSRFPRFFSRFSRVSRVSHFVCFAFSRFSCFSFFFAFSLFSRSPLRLRLAETHKAFPQENRVVRGRQALWKFDALLQTRFTVQWS